MCVLCVVRIQNQYLTYFCTVPWPSFYGILCLASSVLGVPYKLRSVPIDKFCGFGEKEGGQISVAMLYMLLFGEIGILIAMLH